MKKILNKFTVPDYLLIISLIAAFAFFYFFYSKETVTVYVSTTNESLDWMEDPMPPFYWLSNSLKVGDKAYHLSGGEVAEIVSLENSDWGGQRRFSKLGLKVQALYNVRSKVYLLRDQPILVGKTLELNFKGVAYKGVVTYVGTVPEDSAGTRYKAKAEIYIPEVYPWLAQVYGKDFVVKNTSGTDIFRITSSRIVPTERSVTTYDGRILRQNDPYYKDVYVNAELVVTCQEKVCYYNDSFPLRVGGHIRVHAPNALIEEKAIIKSFEIMGSQ